MNFIELFYSDEVVSCLKAREMLKEIAKERDDVLLVTKNIEKEKIERQASKRDIPGVPTTIINGKTIIRGVPSSENQILSKMNH